MSERGSFTSEYIYNCNDYKIMEKALDQKCKYLCISDPPTYKTDENQVVYVKSIISGKIGASWCGGEIFNFRNAIENIETEEDIYFCVMEDSGSIYVVCKRANGEVEIMAEVHR